MLPKLTAKEWGVVPYSSTVFVRIHFPPTKHTPTHAINGRKPLFTSRLFWGVGGGVGKGRQLRFDIRAEQTLY